MTAASPRGKGSEPAGYGQPQVPHGPAATGTGLNPRASRPGGSVRQRVTVASHQPPSPRQRPRPRMDQPPSHSAISRSSAR